MRRIALTLLVALVASLAPVGRAGETLPVSCKKTQKGRSCLYGPVKVHEGDNYISQIVPAPKNPGWITYARATIVDKNNKPVEGHLVHLHHASWHDTTQQQLMCSYRELIYITGKERTAMRYPSGYGYLWSGEEDFWRLSSMLHGMHADETTNAYLRLNYHFTPRSKAELIRVRNNWVPVTGCGQSATYTVKEGSGENGRHRRTTTTTMPVSGRIVWGTGHVHDGGIRMIFRNLTKGKVIFRSEALYENGSWDLTGTTNFSSAPGTHADAGDELEITAVYDSTHTWTDVMGNLRASLVVDPPPED